MSPCTARRVSRSSVDIWDKSPGPDGPLDRGKAPLPSSLGQSASGKLPREIVLVEISASSFSVASPTHLSLIRVKCLENNCVLPAVGVLLTCNITGGSYSDLLSLDQRVSRGWPLINIMIQRHRHCLVFIIVNPIYDYSTRIFLL